MNQVLEFIAPTPEQEAIEIDPLAVVFVEEYTALAHGGFHSVTAIYLQDRDDPICVAGRASAVQHRLLCRLQALARKIVA